MWLRGLRIALPGILAAVAWAITLPLIPGVVRDVGPASMSARADLGGGDTTLVAPPLGSVSADTHTSPFDVEVTVTEIDVQRLQAAFARGALLTETRADIEEDLQSLARALGIRLLLGGVIVGALVGALIPRRRRTTIAAGVIGGLLGAGLSITSTTVSFDESAFEQPRFTGALRKAPQMLAAVEHGIESLDELGSRYERLADRLASVLALTSEPGLSIEEETTFAVLHVSDIHSNPLGIEFARRLTRAFEADVVIDTGDFTSFGEPFEARLGGLLESFPVPYLFIPGNHDSAVNRSALNAIDNVEILDSTVEAVGPVSILGWADPTFTASNETSTEEGNEIRLAEAQRVAESVPTLAPDILAVHDVRLAEESFGQVRLVLAGHTHERSMEENSGTLVLVVGSTGATGLGSFVVKAEVPYEAQIIYFQGTEPVALDYITMSSFGTDFRVERVVLGETP